MVAAAGCTDTTVEPKSTVTEANVFNDPGSYVAFIAKVYAGLAVSGQQGPAGQPDISGIDEGFSQYVRLLWEAQELPTDEAVIGWGDVGLPGDEHPALGRRATRSWSPCTTGSISRWGWPTSSCARPRTTSWTPAAMSRGAPGPDRHLPGRGALPSRAQLLARDRLLRRHSPVSGKPTRSAPRRRRRPPAPRSTTSS